MADFQCLLPILQYLPSSPGRWGAPCDASWPERCCGGNLKMQSCRSPAAWGSGDPFGGFLSHRGSSWMVISLEIPWKWMRTRGTPMNPQSQTPSSPLSTAPLWVSPPALLLGTGLLSRRLNFRRQSSMSSALASWLQCWIMMIPNISRGVYPPVICYIMNWKDSPLLITVNPRFQWFIVHSYVTNYQRVIHCNHQPPEVCFTLFLWGFPIV